MWHEMVDGLRLVTHHPILRALMATTATHRFFGSFIGTIYWLFLVRDLKKWRDKVRSLASIVRVMVTLIHQLESTARALALTMN
jgi:hypothetical protein